jgi:hypothetical protein
MSDTPETDAEVMLCHGIPDGFNSPELSYVSSKFARKLERERDEARERERVAIASWDEERQRALREGERVLEARRERDEARRHLKEIEEYGTEEINAAVEIRQKLATALLERDEVKEKLSDWENSALQVEADHPDEVHCGCVSVLRKLLNDARSERDAAHKIAERAIDDLAWFNYSNAQRLRAELEQLKEGAK